ncbi:MAG: glucosamine-6-phosphate deaminase [Solibacillus sp.]
MEQLINTFKWVEAKNYDDMSALGAQYFIDLLKEKPNAVLGLATGGTPEGLYAELVKSYKAGEISFAEATSFNLDEYIGVEPDNKVSYHYYMDEQLFKHVDMRREAINVPKGNVEDMEASTAAYEALIEAAGGVDMQLLGIGINGHIGFNEPGSKFDSKTQIVELTESTREANKIYFDRYEDVPTHAITMGIDTILHSKKVVLLISGASKQEAFDRLRSAELTEDFPASALHKHPDVTVIYTGVK